ncbi:MULTISPECIES: zinc-binding dehydrogenase [Bacillaceae]|uniref:zinc-binding dehydrogenase n=1 Tax=Bacillaceae TaxID=186817 RepID=UPI000BFB9370|nr:MULTISPECIES: zinc-binding dehydrogenase [Bacillaceae]PGT75015.1 hypothetical protein COD11_26180 [Bacillus sp. AFS040349]UGB32909.1 zinc-binding dehydrogenase [Metabacillus sp. B2-18]
MKAIVQYKYGLPEVLNLEEVDNPIPNDHQVLVKIHAASVNFGNLVLLKGKPYITRLFYGVLKPKHPIPGGDIAGCVEAVGSKVAQFKPGDEVFRDYYKNEGIDKYREYFDLIIGVNGHQPVYKRALKHHGIFVHIGGAESQMYQTALQGGWISFTEKKKMNVFLQRANRKDLIFIKDLIESGKVKAVIDKQFELSEIRQALTYFAEGHAQGKVVITM